MIRSSGIPSNRMHSISDIQRCISWPTFYSQLDEWVLSTISQQIFLNSYLLAMWKRHVNLLTKSITFDTWLSTMTGLPILTVCKRNCTVMPCKAGMILTLQKFSTNYLLATKGTIPADPNIYVSSSVRTSEFSAPYHHWNNILENLISAKCADISNQPHFKMDQNMAEFPTLDSYSVHKLNRTGDKKLVNSCSDMIRMYSITE